MTTPHPTPPAAARTRRELRAAQQHPKAGRDLPVAIAVGVAMGAVVIGSLFIRKEAFVAVVAAATADSLVVCGQPIFTDEKRDTLTAERRAYAALRQSLQAAGFLSTPRGLRLRA